MSGGEAQGTHVCKPAEQLRGVGGSVRVGFASMHLVKMIKMPIVSLNKAKRFRFLLQKVSQIHH
jgi:hypothetical protein